MNQAVEEKSLFDVTAYSSCPYYGNNCDERSEVETLLHFNELHIQKFENHCLYIVLIMCVSLRYVYVCVLMSWSFIINL